MKREFSFYEFVALFVPSVIFLFSIQLILEFVYHLQIIDLSKVGETAIFLILCYGIGHIIQALGNLFENVIWFWYKGMPTNWLTQKNRFGKYLFEESFNQKIVEKVKTNFGDGMNDYGRIVYNYLFQKDRTKRIDVFNGNYSLFRGLAITFLIDIILCLIYFNWVLASIFFISFLLMTIRMIRFAKYYATEVFRTFYNFQ